MTIYSDINQFLPRLQGIIAREQDCCIREQEGAFFLKSRVNLNFDEQVIAVSHDESEGSWIAITTCRVFWGELNQSKVKALEWDECLSIEHEKYDRIFGDGRSVYRAIPILTTSKNSIQVVVPEKAFVLFRKLLWQITNRTQFLLKNSPGIANTM